VDICANLFFFGFFSVPAFFFPRPPNRFAIELLWVLASETFFCCLPFFRWMYRFFFGLLKLSLPFFFLTLPLPVSNRFPIPMESQSFMVILFG